MSIRLDSMGIAGSVFGLLALGYGVYQSYKLGRTTEKLDMTVNDIGEKSKVDIEQAMVEKAIEKAVDREVRLAVADTARRVKDDIYRDIHKEVKKEVEAQYKQIADDVSERISEEVAAIDEGALRDRVTRKAEDKIMRKVDTVVDGAASLFNKEIGSKLKLVQGLSDTLGDALLGGNKRSNGGIRLSYD